MRKIVLSIICVIAEALILYVIWSFALWDFNPAEWGEGSRVVVSFIWFAVAVFSTLGIITHDKK